MRRPATDDLTVPSAVCSVALPIPTSQPYDYTVPPALTDRVMTGTRVVVPLKARELVGVVVAVREEEARDLRAVLLAPDDLPLVPSHLVALARWMSSYYAVPLGITLRAMLPGALWGRSQLVAVLREGSTRASGVSAELVNALARFGGRASAKSLAGRLHRPVWDILQRLARAGVVSLETEAPRLGPRAQTQRLVTLTRALPTLLERERAFGRAIRQRQAYEAIDAMGGEAAVDHLRKQLGFSGAVLRALVDRGVAQFSERETLRDPFQGVQGESPERPSPTQERAISSIRAVAPGGAVTLFGVTGSGKTLVYLEALRPDVESGRGAIILVPEISLTPQTVARVRGVFGDHVAVLHSGLSEAERADAWRALAGGQRRVVVGARSAVFAPVRELAAIVVDEEHDGSYKNGEAPRYDARRVALRRAKIEGARVVLSSATPSVEGWHARDRIRVTALPERATMHRLPPVELVDLRSEPRVEESGAIPWSVRLDDEIRATLAAEEQVLLLLNRRGFAHFLQCTSCGHVWECSSCSISLTVHRTPPRLRCHYCGHERQIPSVCGECGGGARRTRGVGTQQLERWLAERFSRARLARMDADTTSRKWSHQRLLGAVERREVDILFGTQMISKGLDFPGVTLVGVVDADTGLHLPDFRAAERSFQLVAQVAGRAGRGAAGGRVLVQTRTPDHYALRWAAAHDYEGFAARELEVRRRPPYPPWVALVNVVVSGPEEAHVAAAATDLAEWLRRLGAARAPDALEVVGPAPAPLVRLKARWRWHLLLRSPQRGQLGRILRYASRRASRVTGRRVRVTFDRDPISLL